MVTQVCASVKTRQILHLRSMRLPVGRIHLNKKKKNSRHGLGRGGSGELCLIGMEFQFCKMKNYGDWLYDNVDILNTAELHI